MPKLPKGWVPGKGISKRPKAPSIDLLMNGVGKSSPGRRKGRKGQEPPRKGFAERLREKTPLEWAAVGLTLLIVVGIGHVTLADGQEASADPVVDGGQFTVEAWTPTSRPLVVIDLDEEPDAGHLAGTAMLPPPRAEKSRGDPGIERIDILPLVPLKDPAAEQLLRSAVDEGNGDRQEAIRSILRTEKESLPYLLAVFEFGKDHPRADPVLMEGLVEILAQISDPAAWAAVRIAASARMPEVRRVALMTIAGTGDPETIPLALKGLGDDDPGVRVRAEQILKDAGAAAHPELIKALQFTRWEDPLAISTMVGLLSGKPRREALRPLVELLRHQRAGVRRKVVRTLGTWGDGSPEVRGLAVDAVESALADGDPGVRSQAALALLSLGDEETLGALLAMLQDTDEGVRASARRALAGITGSKDVGGSHVAWKRHLEGRNEP